MTTSLFNSNQIAQARVAQCDERPIRRMQGFTVKLGYALKLHL